MKTEYYLRKENAKSFSYIGQDGKTQFTTAHLKPFKTKKEAAAHLKKTGRKDFEVYTEKVN